MGLGGRRGIRVGCELTLDGRQVIATTRDIGATGMYVRVELSALGTCETRPGMGVVVALPVTGADPLLHVKAVVAYVQPDELGRAKAPAVGIGLLFDEPQDLTALVRAVDGVVCGPIFVAGANPDLDPVATLADEVYDCRRIRETSSLKAMCAAEAPAVVILELGPEESAQRKEFNSAVATCPLSTHLILLERGPTRPEEIERHLVRLGRPVPLGQ